MWTCLGQAGETENTYRAGGNKMGVAVGGTGWDEARAGMLGTGWPQQRGRCSKEDQMRPTGTWDRPGHLWESLKETGTQLLTISRKEQAEANETPGTGDTDGEVWNS